MKHRLSKNLYTSPARFVFEMLQNSDDNSFSRARDRNEEPYVTFNVAPQYITVECNEDGFTRKNLSAICSIGKSSKMGAQGYIGEKGIGFKSVFMAAYKVHIQSENFVRKALSYFPPISEIFRKQAFLRGAWRTSSKPYKLPISLRIPPKAVAYY